MKKLLLSNVLELNCQTLQCKNNGTCYSYVYYNGSYCSCTYGFTGLTCESKQLTLNYFYIYEHRLYTHCIVYIV